MRRNAVLAVAALIPAAVATTLIAAALVPTTVAATLITTLIPATVATALIAAVVVALFGAGFAALLTDFRHVLAVTADGFATLAACFARFVRVELVGSSLFMRRAPTLAGDLALLVVVHCRETAFVRTATILVARHDLLSSLN
jgi:hypothetical protein